MRRNLCFSSAVGLGWLLFAAACSSTSSGTAPCTNASGCAAGEYCQGGDAGCAAKLAAGSPCVEGPGHTADDLCSSSICGGGNCCTAACANTDTACKSSGCDSTGACLYPDAGTVCGADAGCNGANFVPDSTCNGAGGCTPSTPVACAPYLCENGGCATTCRGTIDCDTGNYCASGLCAAQQDAGANCNGTSTSSPGEECSSNTCIGNHCCAGPCPSTDNICRASACDTTGACVYPTSSTTCGPLEQCVAGQHTPPSGCGGDGSCVLSVPASCGVYNCDSIGKSCYTSCTVGDDSPCTNGNFCKAGHCSPQQGPGLPCLAPDACISGICQTNCCTAACGVDATLNCQGTCDNTGACGHPTCAPGYGCSGTPFCNTTCAADTDCAPGSGYTCSNPVNGSCCLPPVAGGTIYVDGKLGSDTNCCDTAGSACMTVTHAMKLAFSAGVTGMTLNVTWNGNSAVQADWNPATPETYPIHLGMGVTVKAPGIFFTPPLNTSPPVDIFDVFSYNATDTGKVTIEGDPNVDFVYIGIDTTQTNLLSTAVAVNASIGTQVPIILTDVWMNAQTESLNLGSGANVTVGPDPVIIGSGLNTSKPIPNISSPGIGINCLGTTANRATLQDDPAGTNILQIDSQDTGHTQTTKGEMYIADNCDVSLTQGSFYGPPPPCPSPPKPDGEGIIISGSSKVNLVGGSVQCMYNHGIDMGESPLLGSPTLTMDNFVIQHTGQTGLKVNGGTVGPVTNSSVYHCRLGSVIQLQASVDFSGGGNTFSCNINGEDGAYNDGLGPVNGVSVWNSGNTVGVNAANVLWDDAPPGYWLCTDGTGGASNCSCQSGSCSGSNQASPDNAEAVSDFTSLTVPIDLSDAGLQTKFGVCN